MPIKYLVTYGGGYGPDIWDGEVIVEAENIFEGLRLANEKLIASLGRPFQIFSIEQQD